MRTSDASRSPLMNDQQAREDYAKDRNVLMGRLSGSETFHEFLSVRLRFLAKVELYRKAVLLMALMSQARVRAGFEKVLHCYEGLIFGPKATPSELTKLTALKAAMSDMVDLIERGGRGRELAWSSAWFQDIGHDEHNPVELALFAAAWMDENILAAKVIEDCVKEFDVA